MLRLPKTLPYDTAKPNYSPKTRRIIGKPLSVKRAVHRPTLSDVPKLSVPVSTKVNRYTMRYPQNRESTKLPLNSIISPKSKPAATSRPKSFGLADMDGLLNTSEISVRPKLKDAGISTEQILQSYSCRANEQQEELMEVWKTMKPPCSAGVILKNFASQLSNYEQNEILSYSEIFYFGLGSKKVKNNLNSANFGYDDDRGDYKVVVGDHVAYRFEVVKVLGQGSFGQVLRVLDHKTQQKLALKIIRNKSRFHKQALVEIEILKFLKEKDMRGSFSVIHLVDNFMFRKHVVNNI
jgi:dual specificity tyrosine-phosphorylation-regulated kinase 2/3/4